MSSLRGCRNKGVITDMSCIGIVGCMGCVIDGWGVVTVSGSSEPSSGVSVRLTVVGVGVVDVGGFRERIMERVTGPNRRSLTSCSADIKCCSVSGTAVCGRYGDAVRTFGSPGCGFGKPVMLSALSGSG